MLLSPEKLLAFKGAFVIILLVCVVGAIAVPQFSHAGLLTSILKFFSGSGNIEEHFPATTRRSLNRLIARLMDEKRIIRDGAPQSAGTRYRAPDAARV